MPTPRKRRAAASNQVELGFNGPDGASDAYNPTPIINEIRGHVESWRRLSNPTGWGVTPATQRLLTHWRHHEFQGARPFFCQIEAVEVAIWLAEVARGRRQYAHIFKHLELANADANPDLFRIGLKLATGAGKTTVMAMLIAWQAVNAARHPNSRLFSRGFLIVAPGITIKDRLRVLQPSGAESYYRSRELVPPDLMPELGKAKIEIVNYHAFQQRQRLDTNAVGQAVLAGWRQEMLNTRETEGEMLSRAWARTPPQDHMGTLDVAVVDGGEGDGQRVRVKVVPEKGKIERVSTPADGSEHLRLSSFPTGWTCRVEGGESVTIGADGSARLPLPSHPAIFTGGAGSV